MKPKPFSALNHLTVPCAMRCSFLMRFRDRVLVASGCDEGRRHLDLPYNKTPAAILRVSWDKPKCNCNRDRGYDMDEPRVNPRLPRTAASEVELEERNLRRPTDLHRGHLGLRHRRGGR